MRFTIWIILVTLSIANGCIAGALLADAAPAVSSTNQTGGVTAGTIGIVNVAPKLDPLRERLMATMVAYNKTQFENVQKAIKSAYFVVPVDQSDPVFQTRDKFPKAHLFIATDDSELPGDKIPRCRVRNGISLIGYSTTPTTTVTEAETELSYLPSGNPLLQAICSGLARTATTVFPDVMRHGIATDAPTVFDFLTRGDSSFLRIILMPAKNSDLTFDAGLVRGYWAGALTGDYIGAPLSVDDLDPESFSNLKSAVEAGTSFKVARPLPQFALQSADFNHPYAPIMLKDYEGRIESMDALWLKYLEAVSLTIGGKSIQIKHQGNYASILSMYSSRDVGSTDFWHHIGEFNSFMEQLACIGARFAVEKGYAKSIDLPASSQCVNWQVRINQ